MRGDESKLGQAEIQGFNLFMAKAKCATCHFLPLFNGTVPPSYHETEAEVLAVPSESDTTDATPDADLGKYNTFKRNLYSNAFKTPSVRNAGLTDPYMHNGVYSTLEQVMDFYNRGAGAGIGIELENRTLPKDTLGLTKEEQKHLIAFIHSLTDTTGLTRVPNALPEFQDKALPIPTRGFVKLWNTRINRAREVQNWQPLIPEYLSRKRTNFRSGEIYSIVLL